MSLHNEVDRKKVVFRVLAITLSFLGLERPLWAGVFNLAHFVYPGEFALGIEPELTLSSGAGLGVNFKYTQGLSNLSNFTALIGTGGGPRKFRVGGNFTLDFFPDLQGQPGIGLAVQGIYYRLVDTGQFEFTGVPYIHKSFVSNGNEVEPFLAIPFGLAFSDGRYKSISSISIGSMFKSSENLRYVIEVGVAIANTESTVSGGIVYYH